MAPKRAVANGPNLHAIVAIAILAVALRDKRAMHRWCWLAFVITFMTR
jgi:hypothetical protein